VLVIGPTLCLTQIDAKCSIMKENHSVSSAPLEIIGVLPHSILVLTVALLYYAFFGSAAASFRASVSYFATSVANMAAHSTSTGWAAQLNIRIYSSSMKSP
jgi:hypothetical protein